MRTVSSGVRWVLGSTLLVAAAVAGFFFLLGRQIQGTYDKTCMTVSAIATDAPKMRYVQAWAAARIRDERFMQVIRVSPSFERGDPRSPHYIDLDWRSLGFTPEIAWLEFNLHRRDGSTVDAMDIASVRLHQGRSSILISLNAAGDLGLRWPPALMAKLQPISQGVFVYCEFSEGPRR